MQIFYAYLNKKLIAIYSILKPKRKALEKWYMLELQLKLPSVRVIGHVYSKDQFGNTKKLPFPIYSERMCKRLLLTKGDTASLSLSLECEVLSVQHFRLVSVSKRFARSRMLKKLKLLHPRYKSQRDENHHHTDSLYLNLLFRWLSFSANHDSKSLSTTSLWIDYSTLFEDSSSLIPYTSWVSKFEKANTELDNSIIGYASYFRHRPLISILMAVHNISSSGLVSAIESVQKQSYQNWELCIASHAVSDAPIRLILDRYAGVDTRFKIVFFDDISSATTNSAFSLAQGEWIILLDYGDILAEHALFWIVDAINIHPSCRLIYSDEDKIDERGVRSEPYFKCSWNLDLFYSQNIFLHFGVFQTELVREVGGFRIDMEGAQSYDLALRYIERIEAERILHVPRVLCHWRVPAEDTEYPSDTKLLAIVAGQSALNEHFLRTGAKATAEFVRYGYRIRYALPAALPLVSLIIPTRNQLTLLRQCIDSILKKTTYSNYEIIIMDNGSDDRATLQYLDELACEFGVRVVRDDRIFNYSALNNAAVKLARGEVVGLINNDVEVISPDWLCEMVSHALRPGVGAVGARLWYSDNTLQHAGMVLGIHGLAGHAHRYLPAESGGYCGRASLIQSFSAVTAACLVVRKSIYEELGGLNETELQVACNDVDFCLRAREAGYKNIWTPYAELYHHESASRGFDDTPEKQARSAKEVAYMKQRWGDALLNDPAYSPNLTLDSEDFGLAWPPRVPSLDEVLSAMEQASEASTLSSPPTLQ